MAILYKDPAIWNQLFYVSGSMESPLLLYDEHIPEEELGNQTENYDLYRRPLPAGFVFEQKRAENKDKRPDLPYHA